MPQIIIMDVLSLTSLVLVLSSITLLTFAVRKMIRECIKFVSLSSLPGPPLSSLLVGNLDKFFDPRESVSWHRHLSETYGSAVRLSGPFGEPQVFLSDPKGLDTVLLKEGDAFEKPDFLVNVHMGLFGEGSGSVRGIQHRKQRRRVGPALTPSSSKAMTPKFLETAIQLRRVFQDRVNNEKVEIDVRRWLGLAALEITVQSLGGTFDLLNAKRTPHPYSAAADKLFQCVAEIPPLLIMLLHPMVRIGPPSIRHFLSSYIPLRATQDLKGVLKVLEDTGNQIYSHARLTMNEDKDSWNSQYEKNPSIIASLLSETKQRSETESLSHDEIIGMINSLIFAAHDTSANAMTRCLDVLANKPEIQKRLRREIRPLFEGDLLQDCDRLFHSPFLDAFIKEVLRVYAPLPSMPRIARRDTTIPLLHPVLATDGKTQLAEIRVKAGTTVHIAMSESNLNTKTWGPDAREFNPERWLWPLPDTVTSAPIPGIYSHLMTFIGGSRSCLGMRFAVYEMKIILSVLLNSFQFEPLPSCEVSWLDHTILAPHVEGDAKFLSRLPLLVSTAA